VKRALLVLTLSLAVPALAEGNVPSAPPNTTILELKLGFYQPRVGNSAGVTGDAYVQTFGNSAMLLGELEVDHSFWHAYGFLGVGVSVAYAEKYAKATLADGTPSAESTGLIVLPIQLMAVYRFDVLANRYHIPLVPYAELGLVCEPWWTRKGGSVEIVNGVTGSGVKWGWGFTIGLALQMDFLNPTYAREAREDSGIYHFYLFGEFNLNQVNNFGGNGLNLSSNFWTFGIAFEF
jgi:hypothetical protein